MVENVKLFISKLDSNWFPSIEIFQYDFGIIYSWYWLQSGVEISFPNHLSILNQHYEGSYTKITK
jgi:hypothetical protein